MCKRHSFIVTRSGQVHDGFGITDSHTTIMEWAGLGANCDTANAYEWQPPSGWPEADWDIGMDENMANLIKLYTRHGAIWVSSDQLSQQKRQCSIYSLRRN